MAGSCSVEGCDRVKYGHGWCAKHYKTWRRTGSPEGSKPRPSKPPIQRFMRRISVDGVTGCWLWTGALVNGYAQFRVGQDRVVPGHRWLYEQMIGPIPEGLVLDHFACDTPACVNPAHVRPVTHIENVLRGSGPTALNLAKTHCVNGHPFDDANTMIRKTGSRRCRTCVREYNARRVAA